MYVYIYTHTCICKYQNFGKVIWSIILISTDIGKRWKNVYSQLNHRIKNMLISENIIWYRDTYSSSVSNIISTHFNIIMFQYQYISISFQDISISLWILWFYRLHEFSYLKIMSNFRPKKSKIETSFHFRVILCYLLQNGTT